MSDPDRAAEEAAGAIVLIIAGVILQITQRAASDPDAIRKWKMRAAHAAERAAASAAARLWKLAERARLAYEAERP